MESNLFPTGVQARVARPLLAWGRELYWLISRHTETTLPLCNQGQPQAWHAELASSPLSPICLGPGEEACSCSGPIAALPLVTCL